MFGRNKKQESTIMQPTAEALRNHAMVAQHVAWLAEKRDLLKYYHSELFNRLSSHVVPILGLGRLTLHQNGGVINFDDNEADTAMDRLIFGVNVAGNPQAVEVDLHTKQEPRGTGQRYLFTDQKFQIDGTLYSPFDPKVAEGILQLEYVCKQLGSVAQSQSIVLPEQNPIFVAV